MSHHGSGPFDEKPMSDMMRKIFGEYPNGKLNVHDEGAVAFMVGASEGRVILQFPKPITWLGMEPNQAVEMAQLLVRHASECGTVAKEGK